MKPRVLAAIVVVAAIIVAAIVVFSRSYSNNTSASPSPSATPAPTASASTSPSAQGTASPAAETKAVTISGFAFSPSTLTVKKGTKVTWTNQDSAPHTVTMDSGSGPDSSQLNKGQSYTFTFDTVGTFKYHCSVHPSMHGTVVVTD